MIHTNEELEAYFAENLDPYSDHYSQALDTKRLKEILEAMAEVEFQVIDIDPQVEEVLNEGKVWLGLRFFFAGD